jgi:hypothetical protein
MLNTTTLDVLPHRRDVSIDFGESARNSQFSAGQSNANALDNYPVCLKSGKVISIALNESARWHRVSTADGNAASQYSLRLILMKQTFRSEATHCFRLAGDQHFAPALDLAKRQYR